MCLFDDNNNSHIVYNFYNKYIMASYACFCAGMLYALNDGVCGILVLSQSNNTFGNIFQTTFLNIRQRTYLRETKNLPSIISQNAIEKFLQKRNQHG